ncbi:MAG TPA: galactosyldiacylglycerol synthase [Opitutaceae bacterium]|nr:galactosyldiacylglycerol synthase [Opitutaceae bacterium]
MALRSDSRGHHRDRGVMRKVLILTAGFGEGHNSAARALRSAFYEAPDLSVEEADIFALHAPRLNEFTRRAYHRVINSAPRVWSGFYGWLDRSPLAPRLMRLLAGETATLAALLARKRPDAIVSTYPAYAWMLEIIRRRGGYACPLFTVITDALTINSLWYRAPSQAWFVTDSGSAEILVNNGISADRIHVSGFPVNLEFARRPAALQPPDPAHGSVRRVLYMVNSGRARALATAKMLLRQSDLLITITAGRDAQLLDELKTLAAEAPGRAVMLGWTDQVPTLLMNHHVVISKAGGATTQESINALCPMIVNQIVPGQEQGNYELLRLHNAAALAETPEAIVASLNTLFANEGARWRDWRANLREIAKPNAARTIAATVLQAIGQPWRGPVESPQPAVVDG